MTAVTLFWGKKKGNKKYLRGIEARGHSESGDKGEDIVCAAVSALMHSLILGLQEVAEIAVDAEVDPSAPLMSVKWRNKNAASVDLLTRTTALSLKEIASRYDEYVSISEVYLT